MKSKFKLFDVCLTVFIYSIIIGCIVGCVYSIKKASGWEARGTWGEKHGWNITGTLNVVPLPNLRVTRFDIADGIANELGTATAEIINSGGTQTTSIYVGFHDGYPWPLPVQFVSAIT